MHAQHSPKFRLKDEVMHTGIVSRRVSFAVILIPASCKSSWSVFKCLYIHQGHLIAVSFQSQTPFFVCIALHGIDMHAILGLFCIIMQLLIIAL